MATQKLKILFITADKYPPYRVDLTVLFGKQLAIKKGHNIDWVLQSEQPQSGRRQIKLYNGLAYVGPNSNNLTIGSRVKSLISGVLHDFIALKILKRKKYDLLIVKDKFISGVVALLASKLFNVKFIYWLSFPFAEDAIFRVNEKLVRFPILYLLKGRLFKILLYKIIMPNCRHAFVQTEYMKERIIAHGVLSECMTAVPMAVSVEDIPFYGYREPYENYFTNPVVVYLGTLIKIRHMEFLVRSFKKVLEQMPNAKLFLVGGSEIRADEEDLRIEAEKLGISDSVVITGFLPQSKAWEYAKDASVCVSPIYPSPSFDVGSPTKLLEYMAMGKASVANEHPEQKLVLSESEAGICVPWSEDAFSDAILFLLNNIDVAKEMGRRGHNYIIKNRNYTHTANFLERRLMNIADT